MKMAGYRLTLMATVKSMDSDRCSNPMPNLVLGWKGRKCFGGMDLFANILLNPIIIKTSTGRAMGLLLTSPLLIRLTIGHIVFRIRTPTMMEFR